MTLLQKIQNLKWTPDLPYKLKEILTSFFGVLDNILTIFAPIVHTHIEADITNLDKYTQAEVDNLIANIHTNAVNKVTVKLTENINKGQAVYVSGANGTNILVTKASNTTEATSGKTLGLLETTGVTNDIVNVVTEGLLVGLNTSSATIGDAVWLGTNGNLVYGLTNKPHAPAHLVYIGVVTRVNTNSGEIFVKPQNGFELDELHDVLITNPQSGEVIQRDGSLWKNKQIIEDIIVNGVIDKAPSQNAVFDALSSKLSNSITDYPDATLPISDTTPLLVNQGGVWKKVNKSDIIKSNYIWSIPYFNINYNNSAPYNWFSLSGFSEFYPTYSFNTTLTNKALLPNFINYHTHIFYSSQIQKIKSIAFFYAYTDFEIVIFKTNLQGNNPLEIFFSETINNFIIENVNIELQANELLHFFFKVRNKNTGSRHFGKLNLLLE